MSCVYCSEDRYWICGPGADCDEIITQASAPECKNYTHFADQQIVEGYYRAWCLRGQCAAVLVPDGEEPAGSGWFDAGAIPPDRTDHPLGAGTYEIWTKMGVQNGCNVKVKPKV